MAYDEQLADRVRQSLRQRSVPFDVKQMMGGLCFMVDGKMCVGVEKDRLMARIDPDAYDEALTRRGCTPMDFTGRPMRGFVFVSGDGLRSPREFEHWVSLALDFNPRAAASRTRKKKSQRTKGARR